jgi:hypothetical protein
MATMTNRDYQVIVVSAVLREIPEMSVIAAGGVDFLDTPTGFRKKIDIIELWQMSEPWDEVIMRAERVASNPDFFLQEANDQVSLIVDTTDSDQSTIDQLLNMDRYGEAVVLTNEREHRYHSGQYYRPMRDIVAALVNAYQKGRIVVAGDLELSTTLESSISRVTIRAATEIEPLALSVALISWKAGEELPFED